MVNAMDRLDAAKATVYLVNERTLKQAASLAGSVNDMAKS